MATSIDTMRLRVFFIPYFTSSHIISMFDVARLMAAARPGVVETTIVLTPANADLIRPKLACAAASGLPVRLILYPFPSYEVGLPSGLENLSSVSSSETSKVEEAVVHARPAHERILREHLPDAVVVGCKLL